MKVSKIIIVGTMAGEYVVNIIQEKFTGRGYNNDYFTGVIIEKYEKREKMIYYLLF